MIQPGNNCPARIKSASVKYVRETGGFDCSVDETYVLRLPAAGLTTGLGLRWTGNGGDFVDTGCLTAYDPTVHMDGPSALLVGLDRLSNSLSVRASLCWTIVGENWYLVPDFLIHTMHQCESRVPVNWGQEESRISQMFAESEKSVTQAVATAWW